MVDIKYQASDVLSLSDISMENWIALNLRFKTIMITKEKFVILYNEKSLEEHKERLILSYLGFDPDNEKGDEWLPADEEEEYDTSTHIQVVEKLNTNWEIYERFDYPDVPDEEEEMETIFSIQMREYRRDISMGHPY